MQDCIQLRTLSPGMGKFNNMSKSCGTKSPAKGRPNTKPLGVASSKRYLSNIDVPSKSQKHAKGIVHTGANRNYSAVLDTRVPEAHNMYRRLGDY